MKIWTYGEASAKILADMDLTNDPFITPTELMAYFNEAIDEAEAEILKLHEDYFLVRGGITLIAGTFGYDMPSDIYANKIRKMLYINGSLRYRINRYRRLEGIEEFEDDLAYAVSTKPYKYLITNDGTDGRQICFGPTPQENGAFVKMWYIRNANRMVDDDSEIDIPEFVNFLMVYAKAMIKAKQNGNVMPADQAALVQQQRDMMVSTLTQMVDDDDTTVEMDASIYEEHS